MPSKRRAHYRGRYAADAAAVRAAAYARPNTRCMSPTCKHDNGTLAEHRPGARWTAGHVVDSQIGGRLQPEVDECNFAAGGRLSHQRRRFRTLRLSRPW